MTAPLMTHDTEALCGLLAKVEAATGPDQVIDAHLVCVLLAPPGAFVSIGPISGMTRVCIGVNARDADIVWEPWLEWMDTPLTASIDAALALVERVLPGAEGELRWPDPRRPDLEPACRLRTGPLSSVEISAATRPLAILGSLLSAALAQGDGMLSARVGDLPPGGLT